jgi:hypothetical protein
MSGSDEETNDPLIADDRDFYKVEKWTKDGAKVERMLYAGSSLDKAREVFAAAIDHRLRIQLTIRQRSLMLEQWPAQGCSVLTHACSCRA